MRTSFILALLVACGPGPDPIDTGTTPDTGTAPLPTGDTASTTPPTGVDCLAAWSDGITEPDATGPDTQIHATSAFDGEQVWVAWNRPDGGSYFDVFLARMDCAGALTFGPVEVSQTDQSELDPVLAVSGDRLMVAWSSDSGMGTDNLDIRYRLYDLDGAPQTEVIELAADRDGAPVTGNATLPALAATDDGFLMAGSWGHDDSPAFQAFVVSVDRDGQVLGEATDGEVDDTYGQLYTTVTEQGGGPWLAWQEDSVASTAPTLVGGPLGTPGELATPGARPDVAVGPDGLWLAYDTDAGEIVVQTPGGSEARLTGGFVHSASIVAHDGGAVVLGMDLISGVSNRITLWQVDLQGQVVGYHTLSTDSAVSVYGTDLTLIDDTHAVVVYQDGVNPAFRVKAEWVTL